MFNLKVDDRLHKSAQVSERASSHLRASIPLCSFSPPQAMEIEIIRMPGFARYSAF
jgi:hypothetical protein